MPRPARRTLYLHLGVHRTATTNIQATLFRNWPALLQRGYLYPLGVERHIGLINTIFAGDRTASDAARDINDRADAQPSPVHSLILSDEDISMRRDLSPLRGLSDVFDVKVVMALRRQDLWLESWWAQNVKGQWDHRLCHIRWEDFLRERAQFHWIDYKAYIDHIETVFGTGCVIPYVFERDQMPGGPVATFCRQVGIDDISDFKTAGGKNISLTPEMSEFVRHLPYINASMKYRLALIEVAEVVDRQIRIEGGTSLMIPYALRQKIMAGYDAGNTLLAQRFFGEKTLFKDPLPGPDVPVTMPHLPEDPERVMQRLVTPFVQALIDRFDDKI
ncbi:hypothetical protein BFP70_05285 [Thioclava sp. SK-1]|nr:hypothetical protein BFP70_05285 [Thioclava sp. SK-1]